MIEMWKQYNEFRESLEIKAWYKSERVYAAALILVSSVLMIFFGQDFGIAQHAPEAAAGMAAIVTLILQVIVNARAKTPIGKKDVPKEINLYEETE